MNIFATSPSPNGCARALDDKRLGKMILETAQMLCTVTNLFAGEQVTPYKNSHATNKLVEWAKHPDHWDWLWRHGQALSEEYDYRFAKLHASSGVILSLEDHYRGIGRSPQYWVNAASHRKLGLDYSGVKDVHKAYRLYLAQRWKLDKREPKWTRRGPPKWLTGKEPPKRTALPR